MRYKTIHKVAVLLAVCTLLSASLAHGYKATITPRLSVKGGYSSNVFFTNENQEADRNTVVTPGFTLEASERTKGVSLSYDLGFSFYKQYTQLDTLRHDARLAAWTDWGRTTKLDFYNSFQRTEEPGAEYLATGTTPEVDPTLRTGRQPYNRNTTGINLTHQIGKYDSISLGYTYRILDNEDPNVEDSTRHSPSINYSHRFGPLFNLDFEFTYEKGEFEISDDLDRYYGLARLNRNLGKHLTGFVQYSQTKAYFTGETENYWIYDPSIGITYIVGEDTSITLGIGHPIQDREVSEDESGFLINSNINHVWRFKRGSINVNGASGYDYSYGTAENLGINLFGRASCSASYSFTRSLSGNIFVSAGESDYFNIDRRDRNGRAGLGFTYKPLTVKWLSLGFDYSYRIFNSTTDINDYDEDRVQFNILISPSHPIRLNQ